MKREELEHIIRAAATIADDDELVIVGSQAVLGQFPNAGWEARLVEVSGPGTRGAKGLCLEIHDLLLSKYVASRDKDRRFCRVAIGKGLADPAVLLDRLPALPVDPPARERIAAMVRADAASAAGRQSPS